MEDGSPHLSLMRFSLMEHEGDIAILMVSVLTCEVWGRLCQRLSIGRLLICLLCRASLVALQSTKRATKKYTALVRNPAVALLVHDFDGLRHSGSAPGSAAATASAPAAPASSADGAASAGAGLAVRAPAEGASSSADTGDHYSHGSYSITVYGAMEFPGEELAERCRQVHLAANPRYAHFIVGDDVAIMMLKPSMARLCNIHDAVQTWARGSGSAEGGSSPAPSSVGKAAVESAVGGAAAPA